MQGYLENLTSILNDYPKSNCNNFSKFDVYHDVMDYMSDIAEIIKNLPLIVKINNTSEPLFIEGDMTCLRIVCHELMRNHFKYGNGNKVYVFHENETTDYCRLCFASPGKPLKESSYSQIFIKGMRFPVYDSKGREKRPSGNGGGLHFCKAFALAHNNEFESFTNEHFGTIYGANYDPINERNIFWFRFRKISKITT